MTDTVANQSNPAGLITNAGWIAATDDSTIADINYGAQLGYGPNLPNIDGATPLVLPPVVIIVTHIPTFFNNVHLAPQTIKALFERHAKEVTGIDFGYQLEGAPTPVGQDGQEMHMPTIAKRTAVTPTFTLQEIKGNLIWNLAKTWIEMIKQPDTQASSLAAINLTTPMSPMLMSSFTMDIACIQFDETMRPENIIDAWFVTNMWPQETGMFGAERRIGQSKIVERQIAFYGVLQHNRNTKVAGQIIANNLGLHKVNFDYAVPFYAPGGTAGGIDSNLAGLGLDGATQDAITDIISYLDTNTTFGGNADPNAIP